MIIAAQADLHYGKKMYRTDENNHNKYEAATYKAGKEFTQIIVNRKPKVVVNAGDSFETAEPSVLALTKFREMQQSFEDNGIITLTINGNHDFKFANRKNRCSAPDLVPNTYFADYELASHQIDDVFFILMPYIYDKEENIQAYIEQVKELAKSKTGVKKVLITHGVTDKYFRENFVDDPIRLTDDFISLFDCVIIGHIHTPFEYRQGNTLVISPGALVDYQANCDRTGPIFINTDDWTYERVLVKSPHIVKVECDETNINSVLESVTNDIYQIHFSGDPSVIDEALFMEARNKTVNLIVDVAKPEDKAEAETKAKKQFILNPYVWIKDAHPEMAKRWDEAREEIAQNPSLAKK